MSLHWTELARREYDKSFADLFDANAAAALRWRDEVDRMMTMLEDYPGIGRYHRHDPDGDIREVVVGRYRFIYLVAGVVEIRRVRHVRRDYDPMRIREGTPSGSPAFVPV